MIAHKYSHTFGGRIRGAALWIVGKHTIAKIIRLGSNLIMTRLLVPEMFGLMALAFSIQAMISMLSDVGIGPSIIKHKDTRDQEFINTAWTLQVLRAGLIALLLLASSLGVWYAGKIGWLDIGSAYGHPLFPTVLSTIAITTFIAGFKSPNYFLNERKLTVARNQIIELVAQVFSVCAMLVWALYDPSIWSLLVGNLVGVSLQTLLTHLAIPGRKSAFRLNWTYVSELFHFGKWVALSSASAGFSNHGDKLIFGALVGAKFVGIYFIGMLLATTAKELMARLFGKVLFPALNQVARDRPNDLSRVYYKARKKIDFVTFVLCGFLFLSSEHIIDILYDDRYVEAGWILGVLSVQLIFVGPSLANSALLALGDSRSLATLNSARAVVLALGLPSIYYVCGIEWAVIMVAVHPLFVLPLYYRYMSFYGIFRIKKEIRMIPYLLFGVVIGIIFNYCTDIAYSGLG